MKKFNVSFTMEDLRKEVKECQDIEGVNNIYDLNLCINEEENEVKGISVVTNNQENKNEAYISVFDACLDTLKKVKSIDDVGYTSVDDIKTFELSEKGYQEALNFYNSLVN